MEIEGGEEGSSNSGFGSFTLESQRKHQEVLSAMEQKWKAKSISVPTNDKLIMLRLRELHEPIILFGEKPEDRRERLRNLLAKLGSDQGMPTTTKTSTGGGGGGREGESSDDDDDSTSSSSSDSSDSDDGSGKPHTAKKKPRYVECKTPAAAARLLEVRRWVAGYSLPRAKARVAAQQRIHSDIALGKARDRDGEAVCARAREWTNMCSMDGDTRPLCGAVLNPTGALLATGARSGSVRLWDVAQCRPIWPAASAAGGHTERVLGLAAHPAGSATSPVAFGSCGADGTIKLWAAGSPGTPVATLHGRANRLAFHPSGRLLGTGGEDRRWRLWDLETGACLLAQSGHSRPVYGIAFQGDGALVATGGEDAHVRVWDLRSGKCVQLLEGHLKNVVSVAWSPDGHSLASGGTDNMAFVWDLRVRRALARLPAHESVVASVRYDREHGDILVSAGFDRAIKLWSTRSGMAPTLLCEFRGHEGPVVAADIAPGGTMMVSASHDRTWKVWTAAAAERRSPLLQPQSTQVKFEGNDDV